MANQHRSTPIRLLDCDGGQAYDEETFDYFLQIERSRAARSGQPLRLLLTSIEQKSGQPMALSGPHAALLFEALRRALRDTDVMGWYRQDRIAAAVLAHPGPTTDGIVERRVGDEVRRRLPRQLARALSVRIVVRPAQSSARAKTGKRA